MRYAIHVLVFAVVMAGVVTVQGHAQEPKQKVERQKLDPKKVRELMFRKLENSQKMLAALCLNDADTAAKGANELVAISKEVEFKVFKTPQYELYSDDFRKTAESVAKHAKDKNIEAAKLAYLEMTLTCFHCHHYVRDVGMVKIELPGR